MPRRPGRRLRFALLPFPGEEEAPGIAITGTVGRLANAFSADFTVRGDLSKISIPGPEAHPARKDRLWEETCLELFLGASGSSPYWEFNLSPAGHWNVYRFTSYRKGRRQEKAIVSLPLRVRMEREVLRLSLDLDIGAIVSAGEAVEVSASAVIRTLSGGTSHWSLSHPGPRPDFHRREGFRMVLPGGRAP